MPRPAHYWGRPEEMTMPRPAYMVYPSKPGSDVAMETAADFASGAMVFNQTDPAFSAELLTHAKTLWDSTRLSTTPTRCAGSMWLYKATGEEGYLSEARKWFDPAPDWGMSWDDKNVGCQEEHGTCLTALTGACHVMTRTSAVREEHGTLPYRGRKATS
ncbi:hypothetical protein ACOMHN_033879 [Nucella lapillus]